MLMTVKLERNGSDLTWLSIMNVTSFTLWSWANKLSEKFISSFRMQ